VLHIHVTILIVPGQGNVLFSPKERNQNGTGEMKKKIKQQKLIFSGIPKKRKMTRKRKMIHLGNFGKREGKPLSIKIGVEIIG
jgi:hypothetical protein